MVQQQYHAVHSYKPSDAEVFHLQAASWFFQLFRTCSRELRPTNVHYRTIHAVHHHQRNDMTEESGSDAIASHSFFHLQFQSESICMARQSYHANISKRDHLSQDNNHCVLFKTVQKELHVLTVETLSFLNAVVQAGERSQ